VNVLNGGSLSFGNQSGLVNSVLTLTNTGTASVTVSSATVANSFGGTAFSKFADTCSGNPMAPNATCTITVRFNAPSGNSGRAGTLTIIDNGSSSPHVVLLSGS